MNIKSYRVTPSKRLNLPIENVIATAPKNAVVEYAKRHNISYSKMLKEHDLNFDSLNDFVDFAVSGDISPNSGGIYRVEKE